LRRIAERAEILKSWEETRRGARIFVVGCAESTAHFAFFQKDTHKNAREPDCGDSPREVRLRQDAGAYDCEDHAGVARMADISIQAAGGKFQFAGKFRVADQLLSAQKFARIIKKYEIRADQWDRSERRERRRNIFAGQFMVRADDENCAGGPCGESRKPKCCANIAPPEICERVKNEPVDGDGQVQKENDECHVAEESHGAS
jgi:hypothetical protein